MREMNQVCLEHVTIRKFATLKLRDMNIL